MKEQRIQLIDKWIIVFTIIFILTLSNSIFINQIGYFGAFLLVLFRYFYSGENKFKKLGIEIYFVIFLLIELISAIFSIDKPAAFHNAFKRAILIPIIYTVIVSTNSLEIGKKYFYLFIGAAFTSVLIYLYKAFPYLKNGLYQLDASGPFVFQYPITTSEILSIVIVFLFVFILNGKLTKKELVLYCSIFLLTALALYSTYKRTGWIGAGVGILISLIVLKKWKILIPTIILGLLVIFTSKDYSEVVKIDKQTAEITKIKSTGSVFDISGINKEIIIANYYSGIGKIKLNKINDFRTSSPVLRVDSYSDSLLLIGLPDSRIQLIHFKNIHNSVKEFLSPGFTRDYKSYGNDLYTLDSDSGITRFSIKENSYQNSKIKYDLRDIQIDSNYLVLTNKFSDVYIFKNKLEKEIKPVDSLRIENLTGCIYEKDTLFISSRVKGTLYYLINGSLKPIIAENNLSNIYLLKKDLNNYWGVTLSRYLVNFRIANNKIDITRRIQLDFAPTSIYIDSNYIYLNNTKLNRIATTFDPFNHSNIGRLALWRAGIKIGIDNILTGVGDIDLAKEYIKYKRPYDKEIQGHMHNNFIHIFAILGLPGLIAFCLLFIVIIKKNFVIYQYFKNEPFYGSFAIATVSSIIGFLFAGLTEWNFGDQEIITIIYFIIGMNFLFYYKIKGTY